MRSLTYLVAVSLDGYIAATDGTFDAFPQTGDHIDALLRDFPETIPAHVLSAIGIEASNDTFDTVVMGWNTFAVGLRQGIDDPYPHLRQYVFSRSHGPDDVGGDVQVVADDPVELVRSLKAESSGKGIWLCGGGAIAGAVRDEIDRVVLKINPVMLGSGIPLFEPGPAPSSAIKLESSHQFESGVLMASYNAVSE
ncbi:MAG: dihydrofolate reductase family protein [Candidatus Microthrix parvicella]|jgi:dihydrofolate reductase